MDFLNRNDVVVSGRSNIFPIIQLVRLIENLNDYFFRSMFLKHYTDHLENLNVLFFECLWMLCVLTKIPQNLSVPIFQGLYLDRILKLEHLLDALAFLHPDETVERTEPLADPEQFDFVPADLKASDGARSTCETFTANFEEPLGSFFRSIYQVSFGIKDLVKKTYREWLMALPVIQDRIKG